MKNALHCPAPPVVWKKISTGTIILLSLFITKAFAVINITTPSATVYPCSTFPTNYVSLGNIVLTEGANTDFGNGSAQANVTMILTAPTNFEFQPGIGSVSFTAGKNLTSASINVTATTITITFSNCSGGGCGSATDVMTISGIKVRGINALTGSSLITRTGGTAVVNGSTGPSYATLYSSNFPSANAGLDQIVCASSTTMTASAATDPNITGTWTPISGGGAITSPNSAISTITGMPLGDNVFKWTLSNGAGCTSSALVTITSQAAGLGCTALTNQFSAVTAISPAPASQDIVCPPSSVNITTFTLANPGPFNVGDKVLVIQMAGAVANLTDAAVSDGSKDAVFGSVTNYNSAGNYEYAIIATKSGSNVTFSQNLKNTYDVTGKVQLVTIPQFANYTLSSTITGTAWDGATGGVLVFEVFGTLTINGGTLSMDSRGFRGGGNVSLPGTPTKPDANINCGVYVDGGGTARGGVGVYSSATCVPSTSLRGEGIAMSTSHLFGRGALANGGGSGAGWNSGAGGGSNICAGGKGGYEFSSVYNTGGYSPLFYVGTTPNVPTYNGGNGLPASGLPARMNGVGGYGLTASSSQVFMGGGGGAGNGDNGNATPGGNGGGIIIISAGTIAGTSGTITANGQRGYANNIAPYTGTSDATGGGGGGGSIILDVTTYSISSLNVKVNGGKGGNQDQANTCHGNGGGGGGGLIRHKGISPNVTLSATGGNIGVQRPSPNSDPDTDASLPLSNDNSCAGGTTYGATSGTTCTGSAQTGITVVPQKGCCSAADLGPDQTICGSASLLLSNGTASNTNKTFKWYKNGILIPGETGPTYSATSAGTYSVTVDSTVSGFTYCSVTDAVVITTAFPIPYLGPDQQLCSPAYIDLVPANASSFPASTTWQWYKDGSIISGATSADLGNVTAAGTYMVTATASGGCGPTSGTITLTTVQPTVVNSCIASGCGSMTLSVSGGNGGPYEWYSAQTGGSLLQTGTGYTTPNICATTTYWVQDNGLYQTTIGPTVTQANSGTWGSAGNRSAGSTDNQLVFDVLQDFYLRGLTVQYWANTCGGNVSYSINVTGPSSFSQTRTGTAGACGPGLQTYTITFATPIFIPAGTGYQINPSGSSHAFAWYNGPFTYPATYNSMIKMTKNNSSSATAYPGFFDWQISYNMNCARVPVVAEIGGSCSLPVNLLSFTGEYLNNSVLLSWRTSSEFNNKSFNIQRSIDGIHFETIGSVSGNGTTLKSNYYSFEDKNISSGMLYYKLVQVDYDGASTTSQVIKVNRDNTSVINYYPNPFTNDMHLQVNSLSTYKVQVTIYELTGKTLFVGDYFSNKDIVLGENLTDGVYLIEIRSDYETKILRAVKMNK